MPDFFGVYDDMTVTEYLTFFAAAYGIRGKERSKIVDDVLDLTDLGGKRDMMVESLSRGMKQRLGVARVLIHNPQVLLLDEPASGLDPRARIEIRELLKELRKMGKTIIVSSHILSELAEICTRIGIIEKGRLIVEGDMKELMKKVSRVNVVHVGVDGDLEKAKELLQMNPKITGITREDEHLVVELGEGVDEPSFVAEMLLKEKFRLRLFSTEKADLEDVFMRLTKGIVS
jgi:ABC-2 type transport system ATP-binding protein